MAQAVCKRCGESFYVKPHWLKVGYGKYCSADCHHASMRNGKEVACSICGKLSYKTQKVLMVQKAANISAQKDAKLYGVTSSISGQLIRISKLENSSIEGSLRGGVPKICRLCKTEDYRVLAVHHSDRNRQNNTLGNLLWLCHNCHHLVHHYESEREKLVMLVNK